MISCQGLEEVIELRVYMYIVYIKYRWAKKQAHGVCGNNFVNFQ